MKIKVGDLVLVEIVLGWITHITTDGRYQIEWTDNVKTLYSEDDTRIVRNNFLKFQRSNKDV